jgi:glycosyltransferase involved in cell wall biosynthesis
MGPGPDAGQRAAAREAGVAEGDLRWRDCKLEWQDRPWADVDAAGAWLEGLAREVDADVVHVNGFCHGVCDFGDRPVVVVGHSDVVTWWRAVHGEDPPPQPPGWAEYRRRVSAGLAAADAVVSVTRAQLEAMRGAYVGGQSDPSPAAQESASSWEAIHNGRAADGWLSNVDTPRAGVLAAGRGWDPAKNLAALDAATPSIDGPVRIAGALQHDGQRATLRHAEALGPLAAADLQSAMRGAAVYALPVLYEPFGLSPVEAALAGCALVLGDIPTQREVWADAADFVDPRDPDALAAACNRLLRDPVLRAERAAAAQARAKRYTPEAMVSRYMDLYDRLLQGRPRRTR